MHNSIGKMDAPAFRPAVPTPPVVGGPAGPVSDTQADPKSLNDLAFDLKEHIAKSAGLKTNKTLRLANRSFRQAGAPHLTKLKVPASELRRLGNMPASLPAVTEVSITGLRHGTDAHLEALAMLDSAVLAKIRRLDLIDSDVTNAGIAHLQALTQLRSLDLSWCSNLTDAVLLHLPFATR